MNIHVMIMLLSLVNVNHPVYDLPLYQAEQCTCPLSLEEYSLQFRWWARKEVIERQLERGDLLRGKL